MTAPARRHRSAGSIIGIVLLGLVGVVAAIAAVIGVGYLFWLLLQAMFVAIGHAIADAVKDAF